MVHDHILHSLLLHFALFKGWLGCLTGAIPRPFFSNKNTGRLLVVLDQTVFKKMFKKKPSKLGTKDYDYKLANKLSSVFGAHRNGMPNKDQLTIKLWAKLTNEAFNMDTKKEIPLKGSIQFNSIQFSFLKKSVVD